MCIQITAHAYPHYQLRVFTSLNTYFHITTRTFPFVISWVHHICGHDKSAPTAADRLPKCPQRIANAWRIRICGHDKSVPTAADGLPKHC